MILGALVVLGLLISLFTGGDDDNDSAPATNDTSQAADEPADAGEPSEEPSGAEEPAEEEAEEEAPAEEPEPAAAGIGDPVRDGKFEFVVNGMECGIEQVGPEGFGEKAQGQFCAVNVTVKNIGNEAQMMFDSEQKAFDDQGREFEANSAASIYSDDETMFLEDINPGNSLTGSIYFDIPTDAELVKIELHDSMFSGGVEVSLAS